MKSYKWKCLLCGREVSKSHAHGHHWEKHYGILEIEIEREFLKKGLSDDYENAKKKVREGKKISMWDFYHGFPFVDPSNIVSLGEGGTPLYYSSDLSNSLNTHIYIKDEGKNPSGCFKDRETSLVISMCKEEGKKYLSVPSSGNAASSLSFYAQKTGMNVVLFVTGDTSMEKLNKMLFSDSIVFSLFEDEKKRKPSIYERVYETYADFKDLLEELGIYTASPVLNPWRKEANKSAGYEIHLQLGETPAWILVPVGNGSNLYGIYKGFKDLLTIGKTQKLPKMVVVQIKDADPVVRGLRANKVKEPVIVENPVDSLAEGIVAEASYDYIPCIWAVKDSKGTGISVSNEEILEAYKEYIDLEYDGLISSHQVLPEPTSAVVFAAVKKMREEELIKAGEKIVLPLTGAASNSKKKLKQLFRNDLEYWEKIDGLIEERKSGKSRGRVYKINRHNREEIKKILLEAFQ